LRLVSLNCWKKYARKMWKEIELLVIELIKSRLSKLADTAVGNVAAFIGWFLMTIVMIIIMMFALSFVALAITFLLGLAMPMWGAALITVGLFLVLILVLYLMREKIFIQPAKRKLREMLGYDN